MSAGQYATTAGPVVESVELHVAAGAEAAFEAAVAEAEDHHPDLHLTAYRDVALELWTHAVGGLSENDFILAARIDQIPIAVKDEG